MKEVYDADETIRNLVDTAIGMEGLTRHTSTHAAAVVISQEPLDDIVPLQRPTRGGADGSGVAMTQYAMDPCAELGLLKMDFLGLANLTILARARDLIAQTRGISFDLTDIPLNDGATFDMLSRGDTAGVFQLEGGGMTRYIKELKPTSLSDVAAMIALYRPGPMDHIGSFIDSKHGRAVPNYPHPALKDILEETYGVIVYQDQVLQIARTFAGYSLGEADIVRKAMGKKIPEIMAEEKDKFVKGALNQNYTNRMAEQIFALIEPFAGYAFNKAHSVSYGLISYWTAYLKANFTPEYMVALLNSYRDNIDKVAAAVAECRRLDIPVLPPSVNHSDAYYTIEHDDGVASIRFGLSAIKNVGEAAVAPLVEGRKKAGQFESIEDMCQSAELSGVGKKALESLIRAGALDDFGDRGGLMSVVDRIVSLAQSEADLRNSRQSTMFDMMSSGGSEDALVKIDIPNTTTSDAEKRQWEQELLGVSTSNNVLLDLLAQRGGGSEILAIKDLDADMAGKRVVVTGIVSDVSMRYTRDQKRFAIVSLVLMDGAIEVFIWDDKMQQTERLWEDGKLVSVTATVRVRDDEVSLSCLDAKEVDLPSASSVQPLPTQSAPAAPAPTPAKNADALPAQSTNGIAEPEPDYAAPPAAETKPAHMNGSAPKPSVDNAAEQPSPNLPSTPTTPPSDATTTNGNSATNGNGATASAPTSLPSRKVNGNGSDNGLPVAPPAAPVATGNLTLRLRETTPAEDGRMLQDVKSMLMEHAGDCEVTLEIATRGHIVMMEWPMVRVDARPDLVEQLQRLLQASGGDAYVRSA